MSRRAQKAARRRGNASGARESNSASRVREEAPSDVFHPIWLFCVTALFVATPLIPSETALEKGTGVLLVMFWLLLFSAWVVAAAWHGRLEIRGGPLVLVLLAFVCLHCISAVAMGRWGQPRHALNMLWQWVSLGLCFFLPLQILRKGVESRALISVGGALAVCLSTHGYYQYFYGLPMTRKAVEQNLDKELREADVYAPPGTVERELLLNRLASTEPFSTFVLANSLAAVLATWLVVVIGINATNARQFESRGVTRALHARMRVRDQREPANERRTPRFGCGSAALGTDPVRWGVALATILLILGCCVLTKSRGAWIAGCAGCLLLALYGWLVGMWRPSGKVLAIGVSALLLSVFFGVVTGSLDMLVLTEAAKSLLFRMEYWRATFAMIRDYPWLGCGPGNFQQYYAAYKLPEASEMIADPHNFLLEIWATAGTPAMIAFVAVFALFTRRLWVGRRMMDPETLGTVTAEKVTAEKVTAEKVTAEKDAANAETANAEMNRKASRPKLGYPGGPGEAGTARPVYWGALVGVIIAFFPCGFFVGQLPDVLLLALLPIAALGLAGWHWWVRQGELPTSVLVCAVITLLIALTVSGGIGYAGVAGTLWLLMALALVEAGDGDRPWCLRRPWAFGLAVGTLALGIAFHQTMYVPVLRGSAAMTRARAAGARGNLVEAESALREAAALDPFLDEPWIDLASIFQDRWIATGDPRQWDRFEEAMQEHLRRYSRSYRAYTQYGDWALASYRDRGNPEHLEVALDAYHQAVELYPNSGYQHALLAWAAQLSGDADLATTEARIALHLDQLNPHSEQKLARCQIHDPALPGSSTEPLNAEQLMERIRRSQE